MLLPDIAHVERASDADLSRFDARLRHGSPAVLFHLVENGFKGGEFELVQLCEKRPDKIVTQIAKQHSAGGEMARRARDQYPPDAGFPRDFGGVQRAGAAI